MNIEEKKQLEHTWTAYEVKVRHLIKDLIEPSMSRIRVIEQNNQKVLNKNKSYKRKIKELQTKLDLLISKLPNSESINRLVIDSNVKLNSAEIESKKDRLAFIYELDKVSAKIDPISNQIISIFNQLELLQKDVSHANSNVYKIKSILENKIKENTLEIEDKISKSLIDVHDISEKCCKSEKKIFLIENSLCDLEVLAKQNERNVIQTKDLLEEKIEKIRNETLAFDIYLKQIRNEACNKEKQLKNDLDSITDEINKRISESNHYILQKQEVQIYEWLEFTLIEPRYKKKISEFKQILKNKAINQDSLRDSCNSIINKNHNEPKRSKSLYEAIKNKETNSLKSMIRSKSLNDKQEFQDFFNIIS